jgi:hypothetical protein
VRAQEVVIVAPVRDDLTRLGQIQESVLVQALVSESAVEAFDEGVLHRLARLDIVPSHPPRDPPQNGDTSQFAAVITDNDFRRAAIADELFEFAHHTYSAERRIDHGGQAFAAEVVDDAQNAEAPAVTQTVSDKVE